MQNIRLNIPTLARDPKDLMLNFLLNELDRTHGATAISLNTFEKLEEDAMKALSSIFSLPLYTIGPIHFLANQIPQTNFDSIGVNFWKEEISCLEWLESKESRSVIYVNFGSSTFMSQEQLYEFAWGLANSKKPFLWIIRPDLVNGGSMILSSEFVNETKDMGLIASWCSQEQVLNHPSIGGFLTHCGWNSMIESICAGVPMLCWPFDGDQQTNSRYACIEWGIGMEIDNNVKREEVEKLINELMMGENGKKMKEKTMELKKTIEDDCKPGGSSYMNFDKVIKEVLLKQFHYKLITS